MSYLTQTEGYRNHIKQFVGPAEKARVAGLWTDEFSGLQSSNPIVPAIADIGYHGSGHEAKGAPWVLTPAAASPERTFLFSFRKPATKALPPNAGFRTLLWDTGLAKQVQASPLRLVLSLCTAPIEGSLVKSAARSPATAVVADSLGFVGQIADGHVLRLSSYSASAAERLRQNWPKNDNHTLRDAWVGSFTEFKFRPFRAPCRILFLRMILLRCDSWLWPRAVLSEPLFVGELRRRNGR